MVAVSAKKALANADAQHTCHPGQCLRYTRTWLEIPARDHSAQDAWNKAKRRHPGDRNPPPGAPVFYRGGSKGYGHIVLSRGSQRMRSTDAPRSGVVSNQNIDWCEKAWGFTYLGWTEDLNGVVIPWLNEPPKPPGETMKYFNIGIDTPQAFPADAWARVRWTKESADDGHWLQEDRAGIVIPEGLVSCGLYARVTGPTEGQVVVRVMRAKPGSNVGEGTTLAEEDRMVTTGGQHVTIAVPPFNGAKDSAVYVEMRLDQVGSLDYIQFRGTVGARG